MLTHPLIHSSTAAKHHMTCARNTIMEEHPCFTPVMEQWQFRWIRKTCRMSEVSHQKENKAKETDREKDVEIWNKTAGKVSLRRTFPSILEGTEQVQVWGKSIAANTRSKCKSPEVGAAWCSGDAVKGAMGLNRGYKVIETKSYGVW